MAYKPLRFKYLLILLGIFSFHTYMNYEVLTKSEMCKRYDDAGRLVKGIDNYRIIFLRPNKLKLIKEGIFRLTGQSHPPFYEIILGMGCKLSVMINGRLDERLIPFVANTFFLFILLASVYGIGLTVYNKNVGILAVFLISFFPMVFGHARNTLFDFPLAGMVALSFYLLFKTNKFQSYFYSILFGIALGLAQITKEPAISFIFFPLIYYFYRSSRDIRKRRVTFNFISALLFALIVAGTVYLRPINFPAIQVYMGKLFFIRNTKPLLFYFKIPLSFTGTFIAIAVIPILTSYIKNFKIQNKTIFLWFFLPIIIFSLGPNKTPRFLVPILPAFALIIAQELYNGKLFSKIKVFYASILILLAAFQYCIYFYDLRSLDPYFYRQYFATADFPGILSCYKDPYYKVCLEILEFFKSEKNSFEKNSLNRHRRVLFLFNIGQIHGPLTYKFQFANVPFYPDCPQIADDIDAPPPGMVNWSDKVLRADYVVEKSGYKTFGRGGGKENVEGQLREGFEKYRSKFKKVADIEIFDGSHLYIYKNLNLK